MEILDVIKTLIQSGANYVNKNDQFGDIALDYAQQWNTTFSITALWFAWHRARTIEEILLKTVDDVSAEEDSSNLQSPHSSRRQ